MLAEKRTQKKMELEDDLVQVARAGIENFVATVSIQLVIIVIFFFCFGAKKNFFSLLILVF